MHYYAGKDTDTDTRRERENFFAVRHYIVVHDYVAVDIYYIVPDMLSYRNVDVIVSYHMMLDRAR